MWIIVLSLQWFVKEFLSASANPLPEILRSTCLQSPLEHSLSSHPFVLHLYVVLIHMILVFLCARVNLHLHTEIEVRALPTLKKVLLLIPNLAVYCCFCFYFCSCMRVCACMSSQYSQNLALSCHFL